VADKAIVTNTNVTTVAPRSGKHSSVSAKTTKSSMLAARRRAKMLWADGQVTLMRVSNSVPSNERQLRSAGSTLPAFFIESLSL
jgi:hypothetical protein